MRSEHRTYQATSSAVEFDMINIETSRKNFVTLLLLLTTLAIPASAHAQAHTDRNWLQQLNGSVESLVERVSQSVVQVLVTSYGPVDDGNRAAADLVIGRQHSVGSGVVVDAGGFIITNAHVVSNARRVQVVLPDRPETRGPLRTSVKARTRTLEATIMGVARELDLALLKVDDDELIPLPIGDYKAVRQGELVFAFGSPEGLANSVSMGIVSAVARQPDLDNPLVYIQTDAPLNHGNSGGPLVNLNGELIGINTSNFSESGTSQGVGLAIPGALVQLAYPKLRQYGRLRRGSIGVFFQTITPTLADGLALAQDWGVMVADVTPGGPAEAAGLKIKDVIVSIDGKPVDAMPPLIFQLLTRSAGDRVNIEVLRGSERLVAGLTLMDRQVDADSLTEMIDPDKGALEKLGVIGLDVNDPEVQAASPLRSASGVLVLGHLSQTGDAPDTGLHSGDAIRGINGMEVSSVGDLRAILDKLRPGNSVVLQIERNRQFSFLAFELN
jgi:serine protease Do